MQSIHSLICQTLLTVFRLLFLVICIQDDAQVTKIQIDASLPEGTKLVKYLIAGIHET